MDFHQNTQPEGQTERNSVQDGRASEISAPTQAANQDTVSTAGAIQNREIASAQQQSVQNPPAGSVPNGNGAPNQNQQAYDNSNRNPYQNRQPYDNGSRPPYQNGNPYSGNNQYQNNAPYGNGYPYYNRGAYQMPKAEPGSSLANASMILGIISIVSSFTFTVYPAFVLGSIAVVLALLSKGRRAKLLSKARTGMICAVIGLITNTVLVTACVVLLFTNSDVRSEVNRTFEKQYGVSFDEMMEEIMEDSGFSY